MFKKYNGYGWQRIEAATNNAVERPQGGRYHDKERTLIIICHNDYACRYPSLLSELYDQFWDFIPLPIINIGRLL